MTLSGQPGIPSSVVELGAVHEHRTVSIPPLQHLTIGIPQT
jgi:hypothetical protein